MDLVAATNMQDQLREKGAALVEFALILPFIVGLTFICLELANVQHTQILSVSFARELAEGVRRYCSSTATINAHNDLNASNYPNFWEAVCIDGFFGAGERDKIQNILNSITGTSPERKATAIITMYAINKPSETDQSTWTITKSNAFTEPGAPTDHASKLSLQQLGFGEPRWNVRCANLGDNDAIYYNLNQIILINGQPDSDLACKLVDVKSERVVYVGEVYIPRTPIISELFDFRLNVNMGSIYDFSSA